MKKQKVTWNGKKFKSKTDLANHLGVSKSTVIQRIKKGYNKDSDLYKKKSYKIIWEGFEFETLNDLIKKFPNKSKAWFVYYLKKEIYSFEEVRSYNLKSKNDSWERQRIGDVLWDGVKYKSNRDLANELGVSMTTIKERRRNGIICSSDLKNTHINPIEYKGKKYTSKSEAMRETNDSWYMVNKLCKQLKLSAEQISKIKKDAHTTKYKL